MPSKAKRDKERKWKLARNAVWGCVPARLSSEVPATWVPATELVPGGERHINGRDWVGTNDLQAGRHFMLKYRGIKLLAL